MIYFIQNQVTVPPEQVDFPNPPHGGKAVPLVWSVVLCRLGEDRQQCQRSAKHPGN